MANWIQGNFAFTLIFYFLLKIFLIKVFSFFRKTEFKKSMKNLSHAI